MGWTLFRANWVDAALDIGAEFGKGRDAFFLQPLVFRREVPIGFGVARLMPVRATKLTDYGRRYRQGLPISTSRAEGCVDDIGNARMGKRRRMRWSPRGAHNVAVTRATVLDGRLTVSNPKMAA